MSRPEAAASRPQANPALKVAKIITTFVGAGIAAAVALVVGWDDHFITLIGLVFLACVLIGRTMFDGRYHSAMYQCMIVVRPIVPQTRSRPRTGIVRRGSGLR